MTAVLISGLLALGLTQAQGAVSQEPPPPVSVAQTPQSTEYLIGAGDLLSITVYGETQLSGKFRVDAEGYLPVQYLGRVKVEGLTTAGIEAVLIKGLADGFLRNPQVSVEVDQYRSQSVFVTGEVRAPNKYSLPGNSTLIDVLTLAGSVTPNAGNWVEIRHSRQGMGPAVSNDKSTADIRVRLSDIQTGKVQNIKVQDGDTIYLPKAERVFVVGMVRNAGAVAYEEGMTVFQAVSLAGGITEKGSNRFSIRRLIKGQMREIDARAEDQLQPGDQVNVKPRRL